MTSDDGTIDPIYAFSDFLEYAVPHLQEINYECISGKKYYMQKDSKFDHNVAAGYAVTATMAKSAHSLLASMLCDVRHALKTGNKKHLNLVPPPQNE